MHGRPQISTAGLQLGNTRDPLLAVLYVSNVSPQERHAVVGDFNRRLTVQASSSPALLTQYSPGDCSESMMRWWILDHTSSPLISIQSLSWYFLVTSSHIPAALATLMAWPSSGMGWIFDATSARTGSAWMSASHTAPSTCAVLQRLTGFGGNALSPRPVCLDLV